MLEANKSEKNKNKNKKTGLGCIGHTEPKNIKT